MDKSESKKCGDNRDPQSPSAREHDTQKSTAHACLCEANCQRPAIRCGEPSAVIEEIRQHTDELREFADRCNRKSFTTVAP
jgi:hypothetical protein